MRLLIDFDSPVYAACSVCMGKYYEVGSAKFTYKKDCVEYCQELDIPVEDIDIGYNQQPLENVYQLLKNQIQSILDNCPHDTYQIYLTGANNFRTQLYPEYKANRPSEKPTYFIEARQYLVDQWGAIVVDGMEADDAVAIEQYKNMEETTVGLMCHSTICHIDKDIDQVPGWHYNYTTKERYFITPEEAVRSYWIQTLSGDATDNIPGLDGIGPKRAAKALQKCSSDVEYYHTAKAMWLKAGKNVDEFHLTCEMLYLLRHESDSWSPPIEEE